MLVSEMQVITPATLDEALAVLAEHGDRARPLAGATDAMVRIKEGHWHVPLWVNIRSLPDLNRVETAGDTVRVGAAVPYGRMMRDPVLRERAPLLLQAVREVGSVQIRATGTMGGNLGTASPAGDSLPALYALEAHVLLRSAGGGERAVPISEFISGPGRTLRRPDELITAVEFRSQAPGERYLWQKLGLRGAQAITLISLALRVRPGSYARAAYGAVGPTVIRAAGCEDLLRAGPPYDSEQIAALAESEVRPITDLRATAEYRRAMAGALMQRALLQLFPEEVGG